MLAAELLNRVDTYWASDFACDRAELRGPRPRVRAHGPGLEEYGAIYAIAIDGPPFVSVPVALLDKVAPRAASWSAATLQDGQALARELVDLRVERIIGPAFIGYARDLPEPRGALARALSAEEACHVEALRASCPVLDWEHGGPSDRGVPVFGVFTAKGELAALAHYEVWMPSIAHIGVVTHPASRGQGHAQAAVLAAARHAASASLLPQYRTLEANAPSMAIARKLGFERYGFTVAIYAST